jgi:hypothetical protein
LLIWRVGWWKWLIKALVHWHRDFGQLGMMFLLNPLHKTLPSFVKVVKGCVIFKFALDHKVHFSLKIQRKFILKTASAN